MSSPKNFSVFEKMALEPVEVQVQFYQIFQFALNFLYKNFIAWDSSFEENLF